MGDSLSEFLDAVHLSYDNPSTINRKELRERYLRLKMIECRYCQRKKLLCKQVKHTIHLSKTFERLNEMKKAEVLTSLIDISETVEQHQSVEDKYVVPNVEGVFDHVCKDVFYGIFQINSPTLNEDIFENSLAVKKKSERERVNSQICFDDKNVEEHIKIFMSTLHFLGLSKEISLEMMFRDFLHYYPESCETVDYNFYSAVFIEVITKKDEPFLKGFKLEDFIDEIDRGNAIYTI